MQRVLVLHKNQTALMPCHPARARKMLAAGKTRVFRAEPFTIILIDREGGETQEVELKIDPGSKTTGIVLVGHFKKGPRVLFACNLEHRGHEIKEALDKRRAIRRSRRNRKTRYRAPRFLNRRRPEGWLPPSLCSRLENVVHWTRKLQRFAPLSKLAVETVRFDMQKMRDPEISGTQYQQGELFGYEVREYLLEKWQRTCASCDKQNIPMEVEHIIPRSKGGSNSVANLTLACHSCNRKKADRPVETFVKDKKRLAKILQFAKASLKDAAAGNATRFAIGNALKAFALPVSFASGGQTKFNRCRQDYPKDHWVDAACVGESGARVFIPDSLKPLLVKAEGRGSRQKCRVDQFGFPRTSVKSEKRVQGFQTGDLVRAKVTKGKKIGTYAGRVAIRSSGYFNIKTEKGTIQGIPHGACRLIQRIDGYSYAHLG